MQRKILQNSVNYLTFNPETNVTEMKETLVKIAFTDANKALAYVRKNVDNYAIMVTGIEPIEKLMYCNKEDYMKVAKVITPETDKHGLVTSTIRMPLVSVTAFNTETKEIENTTIMVSKDVSKMDTDKALALVRKEKETETFRIISVGLAQYKVEMYGCTLEQFMKIAHEPTQEELDKDEEDNSVESEA